MSLGNGPPGIPRDQVPQHIAIVMDGNGRWAKDRGLPRTAGHEAGEAALFDCVEGAIELGVKWVSAYAFSTENWKRSPDEVRFLMGFNRDVIRRRRDEMHELGVRVRWAGRRPRLWRSVIAELEEAERLTRRNTVCTLTMCVNYGGRAEIGDAARALALDVAAGKVNPDKVNERVLARYLDEPDMPDVDLFLRTSGSSARRTSCSGSPPTPSWSSSPSCGRTSTAGCCGGPARSTPPRPSLRRASQRVQPRDSDTSRDSRRFRAEAESGRRASSGRRCRRPRRCG